jgi:hypothetical protein
MGTRLCVLPGPAGAVTCRPRSSGRRGKRSCRADQRRRICRECPRGHRQQALREHARTHARSHAPRPLGFAATQRHAICATTTARTSAQPSAALAPRRVRSSQSCGRGKGWHRAGAPIRLALRSGRRVPMGVRCIRDGPVLLCARAHQALLGMEGDSSQARVTVA